MKKSVHPFHPFLFALFPVVSLYAHNIEEVALTHTLRAAAFVVMLTFLLWGLSWLVLRNVRKAAVVVSAFLVMFFSFRPFFEVVNGWHIGGFFFLGKPEYLMVVFEILCAAVFIVMSRIRGNCMAINDSFNLVALALITLSLFTIGRHSMSVFASPQSAAKSSSQVVPVEAITHVDPLPDIYLIILDGYGRSDVLKEIYGHNNEAFLRYLTEKGFYIADQSRANYCQTHLSLSSLLNFNYIDALFENIDPDSRHIRSLSNLIKDNAVVRILKPYGYLFVSFSSGYDMTDIKDADIYFSPGITLNEFENVFLSTTPLFALLGELSKLNPYNQHRNRILFALDNLWKASKNKKPVFVVAHIIAPHPPFVFGSDGENLTPERMYSIVDGNHFIDKVDASREEYVTGYRAQLSFLNEKVKKTVDDILARSETSPIIILQGDHGPGSMLKWENADASNVKERLSIFNAYYLPGDGGKHLYRTVTPVNTFRIILNHYFESDYPLLEDVSYFSRCNYPFDFIDVTDRITSPVVENRE